MEKTAGTVAGTVAETVAVLRGASVSLGARPVLRGVDLTVRRGEVVALLGANGSGKSTAVRAVVGQVRLSAGGRELFGTPGERFRDWARIGYVPQRTTAAGGVPATVREVVSSGRLARTRLRPPGRADRAAVDRALGLVGMADRAKDPVEALSGGQHQRVLIARALAGEPELLIMDEPMAGVDLASQDVLAATLREQVAAGTTVLLVLHELGALAPLIDRAVVLRDGRVTYDGAPPRDPGPGRVPGPGRDVAGWRVEGHAGADGLEPDAAGSDVPGLDVPGLDVPGSDVAGPGIPGQQVLPGYDDVRPDAHHSLLGSPPGHDHVHPHQHVHPEPVVAKGPLD